MTLPFKLVSADSHIAEPPDLWTTRIDAKFRDRAPRLVSTDDGDAYIIDGDMHPGSRIGLIATKAKYLNPHMSFGMKGPDGSWHGDSTGVHLDAFAADALLTKVSAGWAIRRPCTK